MAGEHGGERRVGAGAVVGLGEDPYPDEVRLGPDAYGYVGLAVCRCRFPKLREVGTQSVEPRCSTGWFT